MSSRQLGATSLHLLRNTRSDLDLPPITGPQWGVKDLGVPNSLRLATVSDLDRAADTLAAAFHDYAWTRYVIPEQDYPDRLRQLQYLYLAHALTHGLVAVDADCVAVAALLPPDGPEPEPAIIEQVMALHGDRIGRLDSGGSDSPTGAPDQNLVTGSADGQCWTLETLGVLPSAQGRGLGGQLIDFALKEVANRGGRQLRLETSDARNVRLYERRGFAVVSHALGVDGAGADGPGVDGPGVDGPGIDGPPVWCMTADLARRPLD